MLCIKYVNVCYIWLNWNSELDSVIARAAEKVRQEAFTIRAQSKKLSPIRSLNHHFQTLGSVSPQ